MFGVLPLLRGLLIVTVALAGLALALLVAATIGGALLRRVGIDWAELRAYRERRRIHMDQLRQLEEQSSEVRADSAAFEQAAMTLQAFREAAPEPPGWAFWLRER